MPTARTPEQRKAAWLRKRLNTLIAQAGYADSELIKLNLEQDAEIREIVAKYAGRIDKFSAHRAAAVDKIHAIISDEENWKLVAEDSKTKTLTFRSGTIKRRATTKIEILDAAAGLKWLRAKAMLRRFTTQAEPTISKTKLGKEPNVLAKIPGVVQLKGENMTVKPVKTQAEIERDLHPMRRSIGTD